MNRVQLSRRKGSRLPPGTVVVSRPARWGNPFDWREHGRGGAVRLYTAWMAGGGPDVRHDPKGRRYSRSERLAELPALAGRPLACWCPPGEPCHADALLALANPRTERKRP